MDAGKKLWGESRLERKWRIASAICMGLVLSAAFCVVDLLVIDLVDAPARDSLRANLIAVGIVTMFLVMVSCYCLFRILVLRPLHRLIGELQRVAEEHSNLRQSLDSF